MMQLAVVGTVTLLVLIGAIHWSTSLLVPSPCSRWRRKWRATVLAWRSWWRCNLQATVATSLFGAALAILLIALANDCRYLCHEGLSTVLDVAATLAAFVMGMVLTRAVKSERRSLGDWKNLAFWMFILLIIAILLFVSPLVSSTRKSFIIAILVLGLPVLGVAGEWLWPRLFRDRCNRC